LSIGSIAIITRLPPKLHQLQPFAVSPIETILQGIHTCAGIWTAS